MELKKWEIMQAFENGATIEYVCIGYDDWRKINNPIWNWEDFVYRIANRSADWILFQDFINELKDDCSNIRYDGVISFHSSKKTFIFNMLINGFKHFHKYSLKKEPKYRPCENIDEAKLFLGKRVVNKNKVNDFIIRSVSNDSFYNNSWRFLTFKDAFEDWKLEDGSPVGIKEEN